MKYTQNSHPQTKIARLYLRVSTEEQDITRQERLIDETRMAGYYVAGIYKEKASGATTDRKELQRLLCDLQPGETIVAEKIDRISRLPLSEAEALVASIKQKGARLSVPDIVDLSDLAKDAEGVSKIVLDAVQDLMLKIALQTARDDYETRRQRQKEGIKQAQKNGKYTGRKKNVQLHQKIITLKKEKMSIAQIADTLECSTALVKNVWSNYLEQNNKDLDGDKIPSTPR